MFDKVAALSRYVPYIGRTSSRAGPETITKRSSAVPGIEPRSSNPKPSHHRLSTDKATVLMNGVKWQ